MYSQILQYLLITILLLQQAFGLLLNQSRLESIKTALGDDIEVICTSSQMRLISVSQTEAKGYFVFVEAADIELNIDDLCPIDDGVNYSFIVDEQADVWQELRILAEYFTALSLCFVARQKYQLPENKAPPISLI